MSLTAAAGGLVVFLLTVPVVQGNNGWAVSYPSTQICTLVGSTVEIRCTYRHPPSLITTEKFWFIKESNGVYVDLRTDPDYSGRVDYNCENNACVLTIRDLRESDSAEYKFRIITDQPGGRYTGSPGVTLTVTGLQVQVSNVRVYDYSVKAELQCHSRCPGHTSFLWYKNNENPLRSTTSYSYSGYINPADRLSCAVKGHENSRSPATLVQARGGWEVTYTSTQICALVGSTVEIRCTYRHPSQIHNQQTTVKTPFWFIEGAGRQPVDLKTKSGYSGRVDYNWENNAYVLTIRDLRESDSAEYKFRIITDQQRERYTGSPGVTLTVTDDPQLQVHVRRSTVNQYSTWTELTCHTRCQLHGHPSYVWYKDGSEVKEKKYFYLHPLNPSGEYRCALQGSEHFPSRPVYAPRPPSVSVSPSGEIVEGSSVTLSCSSDANPAATYTWYKGNQSVLSKEAQLVFSSIRSSDSGLCYCAAENELGRRTSENISVDVKYAPRPPTVSVSPSGEIVEGSSVTLSCSSDANPAATYTWYKGNQSVLQGAEGIYNFTSIGSEDRGLYRCTSENKYGQINSSSLFVDVQYAPRPPSVSVSPSGEIVEGSSVTLSCSSDANPAATYTWYKENQSVLSKEAQLVFSSIRSSDSGLYYCAAENELGRRTSENISVDVKYAPRPPSVSVSPSGEILEGSSVNLTCSSDANPAATYTWYKENEDSPKASGQVFTITDFRAEHSGRYYCAAENGRGRQNSTSHPAVVAVLPAAWKPVVLAAVVFLAVIFPFVFLLTRKRRSAEPSEPGESPRILEQHLPSEVEDLNYTTVHFSNNQTDPVYSNITAAGPCRRMEDEDAVEYTAVQFSSAAPVTRGAECAEDPVYSTVDRSRNL